MMLLLEKNIIRSIYYFFRFLRLLSEYDWTFSALVVDINGDLSPEDEKEINVCAT